MELRVGLIGLGTIGKGVVSILRQKAHVLEKQTGCDIRLAAACDVNPRARREAGLGGDTFFTSDAQNIINDPKIDTVIELIGGIHPALGFVKASLKKGKDVVTANKALLSEKMRDLAAASARSKGRLYFEASVCGGIPLIRSLSEGLVANNIDLIQGIVNGTSNYILTKMEREGCSFADALQEAQKNGYAEKNPLLDISGMDSAHKLCILAALAFGTRIELPHIFVEGIEHIEAGDISYARELGYIIKLLAIAKSRGNVIEVRVHPTLIHRDHMLADVRGVKNGVFMHGDSVGDVFFYGDGAGMFPTASSVVSNLVDSALNRKQERVPGYLRLPGIKEKSLRSMSVVTSKYYFRFTTIDRPGVLARITGILGRHKISIASVIQKEQNRARVVPVVMMTHEAIDGNVTRAINEIDRLRCIKAKTVFIRTEE